MTIASESIGAKAFGSDSKNAQKKFNGEVFSVTLNLQPSVDIVLELQK